MTDSSASGSEESDDTGIDDDDSVKKRKKRRSDPLERKVAKIRKTFDSNISYANEENESEETTETTAPKTVSSPEKTTPKKILQDNSLSSNIELTIKDKSQATSNGGKNAEESQGTDTLEGLDDLFSEEWSYKKDTLDELDDLFQDDWSYDQKPTIDFSTPKRCMIIDIVWDKCEMTLTVRDVSKEETATVKCLGIW